MTVALTCEVRCASVGSGPATCVASTLLRVNHKVIAPQTTKHGAYERLAKTRLRHGIARLTESGLLKRLLVTFLFTALGQVTAGRCAAAGANIVSSTLCVRYSSVLQWLAVDTGAGDAGTRLPTSNGQPSTLHLLKLT